MSVLTAVCLVCNAHIVEDHKQFETHYETHHRRRQTATGEIDPGESWEFLFSDGLPTESTVAQLGPTETQNGQESEADRTSVATQLIKTEPSEKLAIDKVDVQLDRSQTETHLNAHVDSPEEMVIKPEGIDAEDIQLIREVFAKNVRKVPKGKEIVKTPVVVKMETFEEKSLMSHWAMTIAENYRKRLDSQSNSAATEAELIKAQQEMTNSTPIEFEDDQADQHSTTTETNANRVGILVKTPLHSGRFKCLLCGKSYAHRRGLHSHWYTHGKTKFYCDCCPKIYSMPNSLSNHKRVSHPTEDLPILRIDESGKIVTTESALIDHSYSQTHVNTKIACEICGKFLTNPIYLRRHMKRLHPTDADLTCECSVCHKQFVYISDLSNHSAIHRHRNLNDCAMPSTVSR